MEPSSLHLANLSFAFAFTESERRFAVCYVQLSVYLSNSSILVWLNEVVSSR